MVMTSLIRLIAKVSKWQTFFQKGKQFGLISPVWGCCHERQFNKHVQNSKKIRQRRDEQKKIIRVTERELLAHSRHFIEFAEHFG